MLPVGKPSGAARRDPGEEYAADVVLNRLASLGLRTHRAIYEATGVSENTLGDFFGGRRWPQNRTLWKLDDAIGQPAGYIDALRKNYGKTPWAEDAMYRQDLADTIAAAMMRKHVFLDQAAVLLNTDEATVSAIIDGDPDVDLDSVRQLALYLEIDIEKTRR